MARPQVAKSDPHKAPYPLPRNLSKAEFNSFVNHLCQLLAAEGFDPSCNLTMESFDEIIDGKGRLHFALYISETARQILEHQRTQRRLWPRIRLMFRS